MILRTSGGGAALPAFDPADFSVQLTDLTVDAVNPGGPGGPLYWPGFKVRNSSNYVVGIQRIAKSFSNFQYTLTASPPGIMDFNQYLFGYWNSMDFGKILIPQGGPTTNPYYLGSGFNGSVGVAANQAAFVSLFGTQQYIGDLGTDPGGAYAGTYSIDLTITEIGGIWFTPVAGVGGSSWNGADLATKGMGAWTKPLSLFVTISGAFDFDNSGG